MSSKAQRQPATVTCLVVAILAIWMILAAFPFLWTLWGSFKVEGDFFSKANWANALTGRLTLSETGGRSYRRWLLRGLGARRVLARGLEFRHRVFLCGYHIADARNA